MSALIDARGRVTRATRLFEPGLLVERVPLRPATLAPTFYARRGDLFAWACAVATVLSLGWARRGLRRRKSA